MTPVDRAPSPAPWPVEGVVAALRAGGPSVVALSGGVDSAVVAALARQALGDSVTAITLRGPAVASEEVERAGAVARHVGIAHVVQPVDPIAEPGYRTNPSNRCYFCRRVEAGAIRSWAAERGVTRFLDGIHVDDLGDDRPGLRAMEEAGFVHPLLDAGWTKSDIRSYARTAGLPNWDAPSEACLASRIPHGQAVTVPLLGQIEAAERLVRSLGFRRVRVRVDGADARVVVDPGDVGRLRAEPVAGRVASALRSLGFRTVTLDPVGYTARPNA